MITVGIVEDDAEVREGLEKYFQAQSNVTCSVAEASVEDFLLQLQTASPPHVVLMDIGLPGMSGIQAISLVKERIPDVDIVMFTVYDDPNRIFQSLCAGATGYLLKTTPFARIKESIESSHAGGAPMSPQIARKVVEYFNPSKQKPRISPLTDREKEIVVGLVDGLSYKMIADRMEITLETVRHHIKNIYRKLHVNSKAEVIRKSFQGEI